MGSSKPGFQGATETKPLHSSAHQASVGRACKKLLVQDTATSAASNLRQVC